MCCSAHVHTVGVRHNFGNLPPNLCLTAVPVPLT